MNQMPKLAKLSRDCLVSVTILTDWPVLDPRRGVDQTVKTAIIRPIDDGPVSTYVGVAVHNPNDYYDKELGEKIAIARALRQMLPDDISDKECRRLARYVRWQIVNPHEQERLLAEIVPQAKEEVVEQQQIGALAA